jgi:hypothetical protein
MSSFSTRGLLALLVGPAQRILQDVQVVGLKAGPTEEPTVGLEDESGGVEDVRSSPPVVKAPAGVIRGVRAVAPTSASSVRAGASAEAAASTSRGPGQLREERVQGLGLPRGMGMASELVRTVEGNAPQRAPGRAPEAELPSRTAVRGASVPTSEPQPPGPTAATNPLPRLILRRDGPRPSVPRAPARAVPPLSSPTAAPSEVPEGVTPPRAVEEAPARVPEAPRRAAEAQAKGSEERGRGAAEVQAKASEERGIPVRSVSRAEAHPPPVTAQSPSEGAAEDAARPPLVLTAVPHGVSAPVSSEPPPAPASERPSTKGLPRLVIRRAPAPSRDSQPRAAVAAVPESRVLTPEPQQPPRVTPHGTSEVRGSLEPSASVQPRAESTVARRERGEGIPLMPRGPRWSSRESVEPAGPGWVGQAAPVPERTRLAPGELASARVPSWGSELPAPVSTPLASALPGAPAQPTFTLPPESFLRDGASFALLTAEALPIDRERLEELLVDILQAAARGEGVEV